MTEELRAEYWLGVTETLPAEYWAKRYMEQPWHGKAKMPYRSLLAQIKRELHSPLTRCSGCERPYVPIREKTKRGNGGRIYLYCPFCGHRGVYFKQTWERERIFTPEQIEQIYDFYRLGMMPLQISKLMFCHPNTIRGYLRQSEIPRRPRGGSVPLRGVSHIEMELIRHLYEHRGMTQREIADHLGVKHWIVAVRVRRGGMVRKGRKPPKPRKAPEKAMA